LVTATSSDGIFELEYSNVEKFQLEQRFPEQRNPYQPSLFPQVFPGVQITPPIFCQK